MKAFHAVDLETVAESPLNERSIADLQGIRQTLKQKKVRVVDLQFLIADDGRVVINDPVEVKMGRPPMDTSLRDIDQLIEAAELAIRMRGQQ